MRQAAGKGPHEMTVTSRSFCTPLGAYLPVEMSPLQWVLAPVGQEEVAAGPLPSAGCPSSPAAPQPALGGYTGFPDCPSSQNGWEEEK